MSSNKKKEYEIGYKKPPVATRFPKGVSGNPSETEKGCSGAGPREGPAIHRQRSHFRERQ